MGGIFDTQATGKKLFLGIPTVPWTWVNRKYICYTVLIFYPGFLHTSKGGNHCEVVLKIGALKI